MSRKFFIFAVAFLGFTASILSMSQAKASEWGCEVLLCAASSNPSWQQIPFCQPPMNKLIACLSARSPCSWPQCTQAGTGAPGYQPFEDCPSGWTPAINQGGRDGNGIGAVNVSAVKQAIHAPDVIAMIKADMNTSQDHARPIHIFSISKMTRPGRSEPITLI